MKLVMIAGPPSAGKTSVIKQIIKNMQKDFKISFLKIDVVKAFEDIELKKEFNISTKKIYSGDLCPDHAGAMVLSDAVEWALTEKSDILIIESAGLCLRCSPYVNQGLGIVIMSSISGIHTPLKMGPMVSLADIAVMTKIDLVSQAEREVMLQKIKEIQSCIRVIETNALQGTALKQLYDQIKQSADILPEKLQLKGAPPVGVCTICIGKRDIGWQHHFGVIKQLDGNSADYLYRGE